MLDWFATPDGFDDWGYAKDGDRFAVPVLIVDAWYDQAVQSALALANLMGKSAPSVQTIIPPGTHCDTNGPFPSGTLGDMSVSTAAGKSLDDTYVAFMAHHLRGGRRRICPSLPPMSWARTGGWKHRIGRQSRRWKQHGTYRGSSLGQRWRAWLQAAVSRPTQQTQCPPLAGRYVVRVIQTCAPGRFSRTRSKTVRTFCFSLLHLLPNRCAVQLSTLVAEHEWWR